MSKGLCTAEGCLNEASRNGHCWSHDRAARQGRQVAKRLKAEDPFDLLSEAAISWADASAETDEFCGDDVVPSVENAKAKLRTYARRFTLRDQTEKIREGMARARAEGKQIGRPRKATKADHEIAEIVASVGSVRRAAELLAMKRSAVARALDRAKKAGVPKGPISGRRGEHQPRTG